MLKMHIYSDKLIVAKSMPQFIGVYSKVFNENNFRLGVARGRGCLSEDGGLFEDWRQSVFLKKRYAAKCIRQISINK